MLIKLEVELRVHSGRPRISALGDCALSWAGMTTIAMPRAIHQRTSGPGIKISEKCQLTFPHKLRGRG